MLMINMKTFVNNGGQQEDHSQTCIQPRNVQQISREDESKKAIKLHNVLMETSSTSLLSALPWITSGIGYTAFGV